MSNCELMDEVIRVTQIILANFITPTEIQTHKAAIFCVMNREADKLLLWLTPNWKREAYLVANNPLESGSLSYSPQLQKDWLGGATLELNMIQSFKANTGEEMAEVIKYFRGLKPALEADGISFDYNNPNLLTNKE